jgi:O-antigen/teichoic acid export membrane protein
MSRSNPIHTFVSQVLRAVLSAVFVILCSRWLGAEGRGELGLVLFWAGLLMMGNDFVGGSNLANAMQRFSLSALFPFSLAWSAFMLLTGFVLLMLFGSDSKMAWMVGLVSLPMVLLSIQYNVQQGLALVKQRNRLQLLLELLKLLFLLAFSAMWDSIDLGVGTAIASLFYALLLVLAVSTWLLRKPIFVAITTAEKPPKVLFTDGFWSQIGHLAQFLGYRLSLYSLTYWLGTPAAAGIYANALLIADTIWIFANSFGTIAHVRILRSKNPVFQADITLRYALIAVVGTTLACLFLAILPSNLFVAVFGDGFEALKDTALLLIPAIVSVSAASLFSHYLHAVNRFKLLFLANVAGLLLQTLLGVYLIPRWGIYGACVAADFGFFLVLLVVYRQFKLSNPNARLHGVVRIKGMLKILKQLVKLA